jgi:hypothetical protein
MKKQILATFTKSLDEQHKKGKIHLICCVLTSEFDEVYINNLNNYLKTLKLKKRKFIIRITN